MNKTVQELTGNELISLIQSSIESANALQTNIIRKELTDSIQNITKTVSENQKEIDALVTKVNFLERKIRKNNIIIFGIDIKSKLNILEETLQVLNSRLGINLSKEDVNNIYIINREDGNSPVVVEFISFLKKQEVFKNTHKLKDTGIAIANDASFEDRKKHQLLVRHLKIARSKKLDARIRGFTLEVGGKTLTIEDLISIEDNPQNDTFNEEVQNVMLKHVNVNNPNNQQNSTPEENKLERNHSLKTRSQRVAPKK